MKVYKRRIWKEVQTQQRERAAFQKQEIKCCTHVLKADSEWCVIYYIVVYVLSNKWSDLDKSDLGVWM